MRILMVILWYFDMYYGTEWFYSEIQQIAEVKCYCEQHY